MSGGNYSMNNHTLSQHYFDSNNDDVSSVYGFFNSHTLYQCEDYSMFNNIYNDTEKVDVDVSSG